jgi:hypothetical protein
VEENWMQQLLAEMDSAVSSRTLSAVSNIGAVAAELDAEIVTELEPAASCRTGFSS